MSGSGEGSGLGLGFSVGFAGSGWIGSGRDPGSRHMSCSLPRWRVGLHRGPRQKLHFGQSHRDAQVPTFISIRRIGISAGRASGMRPMLRRWAGAPLRVDATSPHDFPGPRRYHRAGSGR
jgi:hypothetical protein